MDHNLTADESSEMEGILADAHVSLAHVTPLFEAGSVFSGQATLSSGKVVGWESEGGAPKVIGGLDISVGEFVPVPHPPPTSPVGVGFGEGRSGARFGDGRFGGAAGAPPLFGSGGGGARVGSRAAHPARDAWERRNERENSGRPLSGWDGRGVGGFLSGKGRAGVGGGGGGGAYEYSMQPPPPPYGDPFQQHQQLLGMQLLMQQQQQLEHQHQLEQQALMQRQVYGAPPFGAPQPPPGFYYAAGASGSPGAFPGAPYGALGAIPIAVLLHAQQQQQLQQGYAGGGGMGGWAQPPPPQYGGGAPAATSAAAAAPAAAAPATTAPAVPTAAGTGGGGEGALPPPLPPTPRAGGDDSGTGGGGEGALPPPLPPPPPAGGDDLGVVTMASVEAAASLQLLNALPLLTYHDTAPAPRDDGRSTRFHLVLAANVGAASALVGGASAACLYATCGGGVAEVAAFLGGALPVEYAFFLVGRVLPWTEARAGESAPPFVGAVNATIHGIIARMECELGKFAAGSVGGEEAAGVWAAAASAVLGGPPLRVLCAAHACERGDENGAAALAAAPTTSTATPPALVLAADAPCPAGSAVEGVLIAVHGVNAPPGGAPTLDLALPGGGAGARVTLLRILAPMICGALVGGRAPARPAAPEPPRVADGRDGGGDDGGSRHGGRGGDEKKSPGGARGGGGRGGGRGGGDGGARPPAPPPRSDAIALAWTPPDANGSPICGYEVQWSGAPDGGWAPAYEGPATSAVHPVGVAGGGAHYRVRASNAVGWGAWSRPSGLLRAAPSPPPPPPGAPTVLAPPGGDRVSLSWTSPSGGSFGGFVPPVADRFTVELAAGWGAGAPPRAAALFTPTPTPPSGETRFSLPTRLVPGGWYTVRVRGVNVAGTGAPSAPAFFQLPAPPPPPPPAPAVDADLPSSAEGRLPESLPALLRAELGVPVAAAEGGGVALTWAPGWAVGAAAEGADADVWIGPPPSELGAGGEDGGGGGGGTRAPALAVEWAQAEIVTGWASGRNRGASAAVAAVGGGGVDGAPFFLGGGGGPRGAASEHEPPPPLLLLPDAPPHAGAARFAARLLREPNRTAVPLAASRVVLPAAALAPGALFAARLIASGGGGGEGECAGRWAFFTTLPGKPPPPAFDIAPAPPPAAAGAASGEGGGKCAPLASTPSARATPLRVFARAAASAAPCGARVEGHVAQLRHRGELSGGGGYTEGEGGGGGAGKASSLSLSAAAVAAHLARLAGCGAAPRGGPLPPSPLLPFAVHVAGAADEGAAAALGLPWGGGGAAVDGALRAWWGASGSGDGGGGGGSAPLVLAAPPPPASVKEEAAARARGVDAASAFSRLHAPRAARGGGSCDDQGGDEGGAWLPVPLALDCVHPDGKGAWLTSGGAPLLLPGHVYDVRVGAMAVGGGGAVDFSPPLRFQMPMGPPLSPPPPALAPGGGAEVEDGGALAVTLTVAPPADWACGTDAPKKALYSVEVACSGGDGARGKGGGGGGGGCATFRAAASGSFPHPGAHRTVRLTGLTPGRAYAARVVVESEGGRSAPSAPRFFLAGARPPPALGAPGVAFLHPGAGAWGEALRDAAGGASEPPARLLPALSSRYASPHLQAPAVITWEPPAEDNGAKVTRFDLRLTVGLPPVDAAPDAAGGASGDGGVALLCGVAGAVTRGGGVAVSAPPALGGWGAAASEPGGEEPPGGDARKRALLLYSGPATRFVLGGLRSGCSYAVRVRAVSSAGAGQWSPPTALVLSADVPRAPPPLVVAAPPPPGGVRLLWAPPPPRTLGWARAPLLYSVQRARVDEAALGEGGLRMEGAARAAAAAALAAAAAAAAAGAGAAAFSAAARAALAVLAPALEAAEEAVGGVAVRVVVSNHDFSADAAVGGGAAAAAVVAAATRGDAAIDGVPASLGVRLRAPPGSLLLLRLAVSTEVGKGPWGPWTLVAAGEEAREDAAERERAKAAARESRERAANVAAVSARLARLNAEAAGAARAAEEAEAAAAALKVAGGGGGGSGGGGGEPAAAAARAAAAAAREKRAREESVRASAATAETGSSPNACALALAVAVACALFFFFITRGSEAEQQAEPLFPQREV
jgi:hypothetical protein